MSGDRQLTGRIIGCAIEVHRALGPGFLERVYRRALLVELSACGMTASSETVLITRHRGVPVGRHRLDLLVEDAVVVELKTVESLSKAHYAQVRSYLRAAHLSTGLLLNFALPVLDARRVTPRSRAVAPDANESSDQPQSPTQSWPGDPALQ